MKLQLRANIPNLPAEEKQINQPGNAEASLRKMVEQSEECANVKVICGSFEKSALNNVLLSERIPFFKDALVHDSDGTNTVEIPPEISPNVAKAIIEYAYFIQPTVTVENAQELLEAAAFFRIEDLWVFCDRFISKRIVLMLENCIEVQSYAVLRSAKLLAKEADKFIAEHFAEIFNSEGFKHLSRKEFESLLNVDKIEGLPSEEKFWEALVEWVRADEENRKESVPHLMKYVRMPCLSARYITKNVLSHPYIDENQKCRKIVQIVMRYKLDLGNPECRLAVRGAEFNLNERSGSQHQVSYIYIFAEIRNGRETKDEIYVLEVPSGKWDKLILNDIPRAQGSRFRQAAVVGKSIYCDAVQLSIDNDELMCYFGSTHSSLGDVTNFLVLINPQTGQSTSCCVLPQHRTKGCVVASYDGKMIVAGGTDAGRDTSVATVEMYDPKSNEWSSLPDMTAPRSGNFSLVVVNDCLYAVGIKDNDISAECLDLSAVNLKWESFSELLLNDSNTQIRCAVVLGDIASKQ